jgi:hypothetical protein
MRHEVYLTPAMEAIILENDRLCHNDTTTPTSFDAWLHGQLIMAEFGDRRDYNLT